MAEYTKLLKNINSGNIAEIGLKHAKNIADNVRKTCVASGMDLYNAYKAVYNVKPTTKPDGKAINFTAFC